MQCGAPGRRGIFQNIVLFSLDLCVLLLLFQTPTNLFGHIVIWSFGPNYLINGSDTYFFWPRGAVKKIVGTLRAPWTEKLWEPLPLSEYTGIISSYTFRSCIGSPVTVVIDRNV